MEDYFNKKPKISVTKLVFLTSAQSVVDSKKLFKANSTGLPFMVIPIHSYDQIFWYSLLGLVNESLKSIFNAYFKYGS